MDNFSFEILSALKHKYHEIRPQVKYQVQNNGKEYSARQFYTDLLEDNLFMSMSGKVLNEYINGSGNELQDKMKALRSSSAMTYNLLGNGKFVCLGGKSIGEGAYSVEFEKQLYTLKLSLSGKPANLDALLTQDDTGEVVACEMKMTEWLFNKPSKLKNAYLIKSNYQYEDTSDVFIEVVKGLIAPGNDYAIDHMAKTEYESVTTTYDAFQMFKHALACYNACRNGEIKTHKLTLLNVVWELTTVNSLSGKAAIKYNAKLENEHNEFDVFYSEMQPIKALFKNIGIKFDICYCSVGEYLSIAGLSKERRGYLTRYEI